MESVNHNIGVSPSSEDCNCKEKLHRLAQESEQFRDDVVIKVRVCFTMTLICFFTLFLCICSVCGIYTSIENSVNERVKLILNEELFIMKKKNSEFIMNIVTKNRLK